MPRIPVIMAGSSGFFYVHRFESVALKNYEASISFKTGIEVTRMSFDVEYEKWIQKHMSKRHGERKDALRRGQGYGNRMFAEHVWWPLMGHFDGLHPEYEMMDWRGRSYFIDFMWILGGHLFAFEIMDYGSHGKDRTKYRLDQNRALYIQSQGCLFISISMDEMKENPPFIMAMLRSILGPYLTAAADHNRKILHRFHKIERQLIQFAIRKHRMIHPSKAARELELHKDTIIKYCRTLVDQGKLRAVPSGSSGKIYCYEYIGPIHSPDLL
jgi:hypothetical protein